jgi:ribosome biogenesis protein Nip4
MNNRKSFRIINHREKDIINKVVSKFSPTTLSELDKNSFKIFISFPSSIGKNKYPSFFLIPKNLTKLLSKIDEEVDLLSAGIYFGFLKKNKFYISLEGAEFLYKEKLIPERYYLIISDDGEKSALYGNNIMKKDIVNISSKIKKKDPLLVLNQQFELVALAQSIVDCIALQDLNSREIIATNLVDKGYYLRTKQ